MYKGLGFTLIELLITIALVAVLSVIGVTAYIYYGAKAQSIESIKMIDAKRVDIAQYMQRGQCTKSGSTEYLKGKYGVLTILGTPNYSVGQSCPSGCKMIYQFNSSGVNKSLANKKVEVDVLNNMKISKNASTNVDARYLPKDFLSIAVSSGDVCTSRTPSDGSYTNGTVSGTETGLPETGTTTPEGGIPTTPTTPDTGTTTPEGGIPTTPTTPDEDVEVSVLPTPNGIYHHKSNLPEIVLGAGATKTLTIYPAGTIASNSDWDGSSGGMTGVYISDGGSKVSYSGWVGASNDGGIVFTGAKAAFGNFGYNNYDRNWGGSDYHAYGMWTWGSVTGKGSTVVGKSDTVDGVKLTVVSIAKTADVYHYISDTAALLKINVVTVKLTNTTNSSKVLYTMFGETGTVDPYVEAHGEQGGTLFHGVPDAYYINRAFVEKIKSGKYLAQDGYIIISD